ncbi:hypothetical protein H2200_008240 [Cladophialophora chaetospira]|uniref:AB hydrolase-1 domain-containing protein n=1 Tax=Cladophialophora chaetospira TaxID=386627 RepID=A0AA38X5E8_9EURO|nr:hypothetical protein H2200_008240 [Cladophialophora chaetospira]
MPYYTVKDGTEIYYKIWGPENGPVVVFSHGGPLNADNWEAQMFFLANHGFRCIAHDRRGHGRSSQPWEGKNMDTYADDLLALFEHLEIKDACMVGHSTGGGEVARFLGRHGTSRVRKAVLVSAIPPLMLKTDTNPLGTPMSTFDDCRAGMVADRAQFFVDVPTGPFFGFNREGAKNAYDCVTVFSETDLREDLRKIDISVLIIQGDDDQIVPIVASAHEAIKTLKHGSLKIYPGGAHALPDDINKDLLDFFQA